MVWFLVLLFLMPSAEVWASCACPEIKCNTCQEKVYSGSEVKFCESGAVKVCRRAVCENISNYFVCVSQKKKGLPKKFDKKKGLSVAMPTLLPISLPEKKQKRSTASLRSVAKQKIKTKVVDEELQTERLAVEDDSEALNFPKISDEVMAKISSLSGRVSVFQRRKEGPAQKGMSLFGGAQLTNSGSKAVKLELTYRDIQTAKLVMGPKSRVVFNQNPEWLSNYGIPLELVYGSLRVNVPDSLKQRVVVKARELITYSKGGDYKIQYQTIEGKLAVHVEGYKGSVELENSLYPAYRKIVVTPGTYSRWISEEQVNAFTEVEKKEIQLGYLTPVFRMTNQQLYALGLKSKPRKSKVKRSMRTVASNQMGPMPERDSLCSSPSAKYQQCSWACEGNPKGADLCETNQPGVNCVRRTCNASGEWSGRTGFSSSFADLCPSVGSRVGDCQP